MIPPPDLLRPSPAPHFKISQVLLIYCPNSRLYIGIQINHEVHGCPRRFWYMYSPSKIKLYIDVKFC